MAIFSSYVKLPEGRLYELIFIFGQDPIKLCHETIPLIDTYRGLDPMKFLEKKSLFLMVFHHVQILKNHMKPSFPQSHRDD